MNEQVKLTITVEADGQTFTAGGNVARELVMDADQNEVFARLYLQTALDRLRNAIDPEAYLHAKRVQAFRRMGMSSDEILRALAHLQQQRLGDNGN